MDVIEYDSSMGESLRKFETVPEECRYARGWIAQNGILVGMAFKNTDADMEYKFLNDRVCIYYAINEDGTGKEEVCTLCSLIWNDKKA